MADLRARRSYCRRCPSADLPSRWESCLEPMWDTHAASERRARDRQCEQTIAWPSPRRLAALDTTAFAPGHVK